jgi:hypothetical protein
VARLNPSKLISAEKRKDGKDHEGHSSKRQRRDEDKSQRVPKAKGGPRHKQAEARQKHPRDRAKDTPVETCAPSGEDSMAPVREDPIEEIIDGKWEGGRLLFLVRWRGCGEDADSWEPVEELLDTEYLEQFLRANRDRPHLRPPGYFLPPRRWPVTIRY